MTMQIGPLYSPSPLSRGESPSSNPQVSTSANQANVAPSKADSLSSKENASLRDSLLQRIKSLDVQNLDSGVKKADDWWSNWDNFNNWGK